MGPDEVAARYGAHAESLQRYEPHAGNATGLHAAGLKLVGNLLDPFRTLPGFDTTTSRSCPAWAYSRRPCL
jgi:hypothetical protein